MTRLRWKHIAATRDCTALEVAGDYVISHRPAVFTLTYRPPGQHVPLGTFISLAIAQNQARQHHKNRTRS